MHWVAHLLVPGFYAASFAQSSDLGSAAVVVVHNGVVLDALPAAWTYGVRPGMSLTHARHACPDAVVAPFESGRYYAQARGTWEICYSFSPVVEPLAGHEVVCDLGRAGGGNATADQTMAAQTAGQILSRLRAFLPDGAVPVMGVAPHRFTAAAAAKIQVERWRLWWRGQGPEPGAISVVSPGQEAQFLARLPVGYLPGLDQKDIATLQMLGVATLGQLAGTPVDLLAGRLGAGRAKKLQLYSRGQDPEPVRALYPFPTVAARLAWPEAVADHLVLSAAGHDLARLLSRDLERDGLGYHAISLEVTWESGPSTLVTRASGRLQYGEAGIDVALQDLLGQAVAGNPGGGVVALTARAEDLARLPIGPASLWWDGGRDGAGGRNGTGGQLVEQVIQAIEHKYHRKMLVRGRSLSRREYMLEFYDPYRFGVSTGGRR